MKYSLYEIVFAIISLFNNPISISGIILAIFVGIMVCKFINYKGTFFVAGFSFFMILFGLLVSILNNTPDYLGVCMFFVSFLTSLIITSIIYYYVRWIILKLKK